MNTAVSTVSAGRGTKQQNFRGEGAIVDRFQPGGPTPKVVYTAIWDDTLDGHIPAGGGLGLGVFIPVGFVVTEVSFDVQVIPVGPTNLALALNDDADLSASAAISGAPWSTTGLKHGKNAGASAVEVAYTVQGPFVLLTPKEIQIVGTVAASSAGRVVIYVEGYQRPQAITQGAAVA
jgi:hypothetical protein